MLVERENEVASLRRMLADAAWGKGSVTLISGPLGAGKSELLDEAAEIAADSGFHVLSAGAAPAEREVAFGVAGQLLAPVVAVAVGEQRQHWFRGDAAPARWLFPDVFGRAEDARDLPEQMAAVHGLRRLLGRIGTDRPLIMLVDDLQWTDVPSLAWLRYCARDIRRMPVALVVTLRDGDPGADQPAVREFAASVAWRLRLAPLSAAGVGSLVRAWFGDEARGELVAACYRASAGRPLFLTAVLHDLAIRGIPVQPDQVASGLAGRSWYLRERLACALRTLPSSAREYANATAILAEQADPALVERLTGGDPVSVAEAHRLLRRLGVLAAAPSRFTTPVVRDVIEELMTAADHEQLQLRAANALHEAGSPADEVAARLLEVPSVPEPDWAAEELRVAADAAIQQGEPERAAGYLRRTLVGCPPDRTSRAWRLVDLAVAEARFDVSASRRHIAQAVQLFPSQQERAEAIGMLPLLAFRTAEASADVVRRVAEGGGGPGLDGELDDQVALRLEARYRFTRCEVPFALAGMIDRLRTLDTPPPVGTMAERELLAVLLYGAAVSAEVTAHHVSGLAERILWCEPVSPWAAYNTATLAVTALLAAGAPRRALQWLDGALEVAERDGATATERAMLCCQRAVMLAHLGRRGLARATAWEALGLAGDDLFKTAEIAMVALSAVAMIVRDERLAAAVLTWCGEHPMRDPGLHLRAAVLMLRGAMAADNDACFALEHFLGCGAALGQASWENPVLFPWRTSAARLQRDLGDRDSALMLVEEEFEHARRWGAPEPLGRALRVKASLVPGGEATPLLAEAVDTLRSSGNRLGLAKALLDHGCLLRDHGIPGAEDRLRESHRLAKSCGAQWLADRVVDVAGWSGSSVPASAAGLSEAERLVAELAPSGLTNSEIAAELQVTRRAVEKHLTSCYRKLGVSGRAELAGIFDAADYALTVE